VESVATGWLAGINAVRVLRGESMLTAPPSSAIGALCRYVSNVETKNFQPVNITFGLLEQLPVELRKKHRNKRERHVVQVERALIEWDEFVRAELRRSRGALNAAASSTDWNAGVPPA
jgi:methylenetetrahydrofolate--tRNA-(uracil-5-)-methyltransferase